MYPSLAAAKVSILTTILASSGVSAIATGLPSGALVPHKVRFQPAPGTTLGITIEQSARTQSVFGSWCPLINGVRDETGAFHTEGTGSLEYEIAIAFEDTYGPKRNCDYSSDPGLRLPYASVTRTFNGIEGESISTPPPEEGGDDPAPLAEPEATPLSSPLGGRAVKFQWDEDRGQFTSTFRALPAGPPRPPEPEIDELLLAGLHFDGTGDWFLPGLRPAPKEDEHGQRILLPPGRGDENLQPTDRWEVSPTAWYEMLDVGGYFWIGPDDDQAPSTETLERALSVNGQLAKNAKGRILCVFKRIEVRDGRQLAVIEVEAKVKSEATIDTTEEHGGTREKVTETVEQTIQGKGTCHWDLAGHHCHSIEMHSETVDRSTFVSIQRLKGEETSGAEIVSVEESVSDFVIAFESR